MLQNRLYRGEVMQKGRCFEGEHQAIVDPELWDRVQARLSQSRIDRTRGGKTAAPSLLARLRVTLPNAWSKQTSMLLVA